MAANALVAAIRQGLRPIGVKASISSWLGAQIPLTNHEFWQQWVGGGTFTGKAVTVDQALKLATAWACMRLLSETLATLPLGFYRRKADGSRESANDHDLYEILHNQPNADMTAAVFWQIVLVALLAWGNAYVEVMRNGQRILGLNFLMPNSMSVRRLKNGTLEYQYLDSVRGVNRTIAEENMMHIRSFSLDGMMGLSAIAYGANVLGTAIETDRASAETFSNSNRATGVLQVNRTLTNAQREMYREHMKTVSENGGVYVTENGVNYESLKFNPHDAELLQSRSYNVEEICRWFGIDPAMVGHGGKDSNWGTGLEQKMLWFLVFGLRKWCVRIEQAIRKSLLSPSERKTLFAEWNMEGLLRGDSAARASFYSSASQNGWMTRREIRQRENLPPMPGDDVLTVQSNLIPLDQLGMAPAEPEPDPFAKFARIMESRASDAVLGAVEKLREQVRSLADRAPAPITVDARTNVAAPPQANVTVNVPEQPAAPINVDARTTVNPSPAPNVTVNVPEHKAPDVHVDVAAPVVTVAPADVRVTIESSDGEKTTTYERDPQTKEIVSSTTRKS